MSTIWKYFNTSPHLHNLQSLFNLCLSLKLRERKRAGRVLLDPLDFRCRSALPFHLPSIPLYIDVCINIHHLYQWFVGWKFMFFAPKYLHPPKPRCSIKAQLFSLLCMKEKFSENQTKKGNMFHFSQTHPPTPLKWVTFLLFSFKQVKKLKKYKTRGRTQIQFSPLVTFSLLTFSVLTFSNNF